MNDTHLIEFNREALIQMSFESKINGLYRQLESGIINHNEARALLNMPTLGEDGEARYRPANWMEIGSPAEERVEGEELDDTPDDSPDEEDGSEDDGETMTALRQLISAGVAKACEIEAAKAVQIAGRRTGNFLAGMADFYATWSENTLPGLVAASVRTAIQQHASASYAALEAASRHATPDTLKGHVEAVVALWADRREELTSRILGNIKNAPAKYDGIDFSPPEGVRKEAQQGLDWRREHGRGGTEVGIARARDLSNGVEVSPDTIGRMVRYFARHEVDKKGEGWSPGEDGYPSNGRIAWALWGGDPGRAWANKVSKQMKSRDK